ncbi:MAG: chondroitinase-B domain-containing protein [bacterium]
MLTIIKKYSLLAVISFSVLVWSDSITADTFIVASAADISSAMQVAQPGDTLLMKDGIWMDEEIVFEGNGDSLNPIVLCAEPPGEVILTGKSRLSVVGNYLLVDGLNFKDGWITRRSNFDQIIAIGDRETGRNSNYCRLTNTAIIDYNQPDSSRHHFWVKVAGAFNPQTTIEYQLPISGHIILRVFNLLGQEIKTLVDENKTAGNYSVVWDGQDNFGKDVASGVYVYQLTVKGGAVKKTKKLLLLR